MVNSSLIWREEIGSREFEEFEKINEEQYIQRRNVRSEEIIDAITGLPETQWKCEYRIISKDMYQQYMNSKFSPSQSDLDEANALLMLQNAEMQVTQEQQDETLAAILLELIERSE